MENDALIAEMVKRNTILRGVVGSTLHGLSVDDGLEDRDELGVFIEDMEYHVGWERLPGQGTYVYRTAVERQEQETGVSARGKEPRSYAGDLDLVVHTLKKYLGLALNGNPTILNLLFIPNDQLVECNALGSQLRDLTPQIVSRRAGVAFQAYMRQQWDRLMGLRGQRGVNRPDLVMRYGYDTKFAMHVLRLGIQGVEIMETGRLTFPMAEPHRTFLRDVRLGGPQLADVQVRAKELQEHLQVLIDDEKSSPLRPEPDVKSVESWMTRVYLNRWYSRDYMQRAQAQRVRKTSLEGA